MNNLCIHNPKTQITKINLHIKNIAHTVIEQITPFLPVSKNNEMMKINEKHMLDQNLHKHHSFSTFVLLPITEQNTMIIDTEVEVPHETTLTTKIIHKTDTVLHLEIETDFVMTKVLLPHTTPDQDMIHTNVILDLTVLLTDLLIDPHIDKTLVRDTDHAPIQETTNSQKNTNSYRPPSRPRDSRFSRSRSHSNSRNKVNMIQQQDQTDPIKFEVHMYHPTAMANAVTPTSWFYTLYVHTPSSIVQKDNPSRLEIAFLLDSGASISVLNYSTYIILTKLLDIRSNHTSDVGPTRNSKTLTVANQTEVPILHYANIILNTTIDENSRYFSVPFAIADIKYNILGTPFFEDNIQNKNIQDFTLEFKYQSKTHPNYAKFTTLLSKDYPYFSYIYRINSKNQIRLKPKSSKISHFPIKNYHNLHFTTTPQNHFFPFVPHTYFATKFRTNFNFIEVFTDDKPNICATIIQDTSKHIATLPTGHIGYIEVPITNEKPKFFQVNDINTLIHNVTHTYHPDITEPLPQTNYIVQYDDPTTPPPQFSLHQIYMTNNDIPNQTSPLYNVQPTSHTSEKRIFPSLQYTSENLKFINKYNFQFSDLTDSEYITLCNMLLKYKTCYATHKNDVGKISTPFRIRLKPNAQLLTQRPSKVPIHYRDKLNVLLKELEKYNIIKQIGSSPQDKPVYGTNYLNPLIIIPKEDTIKCVLDARHLNSNTEQFDESWPIDPLAP